MNIFKVLSQGNGRLSETNLSAMLGFLLSPTETHGLGDVFLRYFLKLVAQKSGDEKRFDDVLNTGKSLRADINLEEPYSLNDKVRIVDVEIMIYANAIAKGETAFAELHRVIIENKIKKQSSDSEQLKEEFLAIMQEVEGDETLKVTMVFLTPPGDYINSIATYDNLNESILGNNKKAWLKWTEQNGEENMLGLLKQLLKSESASEISPINEYVRHTLKAFAVHIKENIATSNINRRFTGEPDNIIQSVLVQISDGIFRIEQSENNTIRIFNIDTQEYNVAKPLLRKINTEKQLGIELKLSTGRNKNTRNLGKQVIKELQLRGKDLKDTSGGV